MRIINKPTISIGKVYSKCLNSISDKTRRDMFRSIKQYIIKESTNYNDLAMRGELYNIPIQTNVQGSVRKKDMKQLYTQQMVQNKKGRKIYDKLMNIAPLSRCPFCGIGIVSTLDHYLPKAKFPIFSVLTYNLIPCCKDCNTGKGTSIATTEQGQIFHPYYDDFTDKQWLFARVLETSPVSVEFYINPPNFWSTIKQNRIKTHFKEYKLKNRFSVEASNELAKLQSLFIYKSLDALIIKAHLEDEEQAYKTIHLNSWESSLYQALSESEWYCDGGYSIC